MGWSFRKSFKLFPGVRTTVSKRGVSVSGGAKGARISKSTNRRGARVSFGIPGTGIRWFGTVGGRKRKR